MCLSCVLRKTNENRQGLRHTYGISCTTLLFFSSFHSPLFVWHLLMWQFLVCELHSIQFYFAFVSWIVFFFFWSCFRFVSFHSLDNCLVRFQEVFVLCCMNKRKIVDRNHNCWEWVPFLKYILIHFDVFLLTIFGDDFLSDSIMPFRQLLIFIYVLPLPKCTLCSYILCFCVLFCWFKTINSMMSFFNSTCELWHFYNTIPDTC